MYIIRSKQVEFKNLIQNGFRFSDTELCFQSPSRNRH
jgi:hypothetical protein